MVRSQRVLGRRRVQRLPGRDDEPGRRRNRMLRRGRIHGWLSLRDVPRRLDECKTRHVHVRRQRVLGRHIVRGVPWRIIQRWRRRDDGIVHDLCHYGILEQRWMPNMSNRVNRHGGRDFMCMRCQRVLGRIGLPSMSSRLIQCGGQRHFDIVHVMQY